MGRRTALALVTLALLVPRGGAPAGVPLVDPNGDGYAWDLAAAQQPNVIGGKVTFFADGASLRDEVGGQKTAVQAIRDALREWEIGTTAIRFLEDTSRPASGLNGMDRVNWIGWAQGGMDRLVLGATTVTREGARLTDMDVQLNDRDWPWDTFTPGRAGIADVQGLVTHEWGHALGCDHVPLRTSTMYAKTDPGVIALRSIAPDDRALVGAIYPNAAFQSTTGEITGTVDVAGRADDRAVHVAAVSVVSGEAEASTLTRPDGTYRIAGLPAGVYRVVAAPCLPLAGAMNQFWTSGSTSFLPSVLREGPGNPAAILPLAVAAGQRVAAPAMDVSDAVSPFEPNDTMAQAKPLEVGHALCARFDAAGDEDWYSFSGASGQKLSVSVLSWGLGAAADPSLRIVNSAGSAVLLQDDARPPAIWFNQLEGQDLDVRVVTFGLPTSGQFFLRLTFRSLPDPGSVPAANRFYVLTLTPASDAPSPTLTEVAATPARIDAEPGSRSTIRVLPRRGTGDPVGPGVSVSLAHSGGGSVGPVVDRGDGTYTAEVAAPLTPGVDRFSVTVSTPQGTATMLDAATIVYLGPPSPSKSTLTVTPRRIDVAPASPAPGLLLQASVILVPRDENLEPLGPGRAVVFSLVAPAGASLVGPVDLLDGSYGDTVRASSVPGTGQVTAAVDGIDLSAAPARVAFGFAFGDVFADAVADVQRHLATPSLTSKVTKTLKKATRVLEAALDGLGEPGPKADARAVAAAASALTKIAAARRKAGALLSDPGTAHDLARSIRQAAARSIASAVIETGRDQVRADAAALDLAAGDAAFATDDFAAAASRWHSAWRRVLRLQP